MARVRASGDGPVLVGLTGSLMGWRRRLTVVGVLFFLSVELMFLFPSHEAPLGRHGVATIPSNFY
jgi:hypothetical protein